MKSQMKQKIHNKIEQKMHEILKEEKTEIDLCLPIYISNKQLKKILVLSGGGIRGIAFLGAIYALEELNVLRNIETFAGTSVGALIAFLLVIGYTPMELMQFIMTISLGQLKSIKISLFMEDYGLNSGNQLLELLIGLIRKKNINPKITFKELYEKTKKTLIMTSVNINRKSVEYFSCKTHPDLSVVQAVRMSISIPFVFTPVKYNECYYVDGGCIDNFPISQFDGNENELIGICLVENTDVKEEIKTIYDYSVNVINSLVNGITETTIRNYKNNVIKIVIDNINSIDFDLSSDKKFSLFSKGYQSVYSYF